MTVQEASVCRQLTLLVLVTIVFLVEAIMISWYCVGPDFKFILMIITSILVVETAGTRLCRLGKIKK